MMTPTEYDPKLLDQWSIDASHSPELNQLLAAYIQQFGHLFNSSQMKYFSAFLKGLFSSLGRKSLEPIALHFLGEKSVRSSMQQFFSRVPPNLAMAWLTVNSISLKNGMKDPIPNCVRSASFRKINHSQRKTR